MRLTDFGADQLSTMADLDPKTQEKLVSSGVEELFPVQQASHKLFVEGAQLIVKSRTGTGKTLAFLLPLQELITRDVSESTGNAGVQVHAVILEPTRELAQQVQTQIEKFTNLRSVLVYGGGDSAGYQMS